MVKRWLRFITSLSLLATALPAPLAQAAISACDTEISPHLVSQGSSNTFSFGLHNTDPNDIQWVRVSQPSGQPLSLIDASGTGWSADVQTDDITFTGGDLGSGLSQGFFIDASASPTPVATGYWTIQVSDNPSGAGATVCTGDMSLTVSSDPSVINISGLTVSNIGPDTVTIGWSTDVASTTRVLYGPDTSYPESSPLQSALTYGHAVTLTGLTPNTGYYYKVRSTTPADGGEAESGDNTFLTALPAPAPIIVVNNPAPLTGANVPGATINTTPTEHVPPTVAITTSLAAPFEQAPLISGTADDNAAVARLEYSTDGGVNWLPVDRITRPPRGGVVSAAHVAFSFTPALTEDGNYTVQVRALDSSGNAATTAPAKLVIDRLPPQLGPLVIAHGPEVIQPQDGVLELQAGSVYKLTASAVGGPTSLVLEATPQEQLGATTTFTLTQSADSGLWSGSLSFGASGIYRLTARGLDGAGNRTSRVLTTVNVIPSGHITDTATGKGLAGARLTLYYFEPSTGTWHLWDGAPYSQPNPQTTAADGHYSLLVPKGRYYLRVTAPGHTTFTSNSFDVNTSLSVASTIPLAPRPQLTLGGFTLALPQLNLASQPLPAPAHRAVAGSSAASLVGSQVPAFRLPTTTGAAKRNINYEGRPTVYSFVTTWSPASQAQLAPLAAAQANRDVNVVPVFSQEHETMVGVYLSTAGSGLTGLVDPDGVLVPSLQLGAVPQHIFVDRSGRIKKVMLGVLSKQQLLDQLGRL